MIQWNIEKQGWCACTIKIVNIDTPDIIPVIILKLKQVQCIQKISKEWWTL